jgi:hypothetical protein
VTPFCAAGSPAGALTPPSPRRTARTAIGAWHCVQNAPIAPPVSRWARAFMATKRGSIEA